MIKVFLLLLASGKLGKVLLTTGTMILSILAYTYVFGWQYAVGFVGLIFVHEMGHYLAAHQRGLKVGAPTFIPFVGAWIQLKDKPHDAETEAYVGMAGPLVGSIAALGCYIFARQHHNDSLFLALSYAGFSLNLFNLIPVSPFDGGRITAVISPRLWLLGAPVLAALFYYRPSPLLVVMLVLAAPQILQAWRYNPSAPENVAYYDVSTEQRMTYSIYYVALVGFLAVMTYDVHEMLMRLHLLSDF